MHLLHTPQASMGCVYLCIRSSLAAHSHDMAGTHNRLVVAEAPSCSEGAAQTLLCRHGWQRPSPRVATTTDGPPVDCQEVVWQREVLRRGVIAVARALALLCGTAHLHPVACDGAATIMTRGLPLQQERLQASMAAVIGEASAAELSL